MNGSYDQCHINDECYDDVNGDEDHDFILPVSVNGVDTYALRDSGNLALVIVDERLIPKQDIRHDKSVYCVGAFDRGKPKKIPTAIVKSSSSMFWF